MAVAILVIALLITLSGCNGISDTASPSANTTSNSSNISDNITTTSARDTPTETGTETPQYTVEQKYNYFRNGYIESVKNKGVNITASSLDQENETLYVTYEMSDPKSNTTTGRERENISFGYVSGVEYYTVKNGTNVDSTWVPKRVNVTALTPDGGRYETASITFDRAKKMIDDEISARRYLLEYYGTIEKGPANPEYDGQ